MADLGGSRHNRCVSEYITSMSSRTAMNYLMNLQESEIHTQLVDANSDRHRAAYTHVVLAVRYGVAPKNIRSYGSTTLGRLMRSMSKLLQ